jgi:hypothetical protein
MTPHGWDVQHHCDQYFGYTIRAHGGGDYGAAERTMPGEVHVLNGAPEARGRTAPSGGRPGLSAAERRDLSGTSAIRVVHDQVRPRSPGAVVFSRFLQRTWQLSSCVSMFNPLAVSVQSAWLAEDVADRFMKVIGARQSTSICLGTILGFPADNRRSEAVSAAPLRPDLSTVRRSRMCHRRSKHGFKPTADDWNNFVKAATHGKNRLPKQTSDRRARIGFGLFR